MKSAAFLLISLFPFVFYTQYWEEISNFPGTARDDGVAFVLQNKAYCGTGLQIGWSPTRDFYVLNLENDSWETGVSLPVGKERWYACGFSNNQNGFVFGGYKSSTYLKDLWMFDPQTNTWTEKASLPGNGRSGSSCFVINNKAYIVGGIIADNVYTDEVWEYDINTNSWLQKNNCLFGTSFKASSCSKNGIGYLLFGQNQNLEISNKLLSYNPFNDSWSQQGNFPLQGRTYSSMISFGGYLLVLFGLDSSATYMNDCWSYSLNNNEWTQLANLPSPGIMGGMCFSSSDNIYYTTGLDTNGRRVRTWKLSKLFSGTFSEKENPYLRYDPTSKLLELTSSTVPFSFAIIDVSGRTIDEGKPDQMNHQVDLSSLSDGIYYIQVNSQHLESSFKFVKY